MLPGPTRFSIRNCISIGSAVFAELTAEVHIQQNVRQHAINARFNKLIPLQPYRKLKLFAVSSLEGRNYDSVICITRA